MLPAHRASRLELHQTLFGFAPTVQDSFFFGLYHSFPGQSWGVLSAVSALAGEPKRLSSEETMQIVSVRRVALGCLFIAATPFVRTAFAQPGPEPAIRLRFYDEAGIDPRVLEKAQQQMKRIFKRIGVNAEWEVDG